MRLSSFRPTPADLGLTAAEGRVLLKLDTPQKIQRFVSGLHANFEEYGDTLRSVRGVLKHREAHCIEAAFLASCTLWLHGEPPLVMDMRATGDSDHVVTLFRRGSSWGAISKSNHVWLRWRDPVYRSLRELAMSYFHEYTNTGRKTLRSYSRAVDLRRFPIEMWVTNPEECWDVGAALDDVHHYRLISRAQAARLTPRDKTERRADKMLQYTTWKKTRARR